MYDLSVSNGQVGLKLKMIEWVEIKIGLSYDPPKLTLGSTRLKFKLSYDPLNLRLAGHFLAAILLFHNEVCSFYLITHKLRLAIVASLILPTLSSSTLATVASLMHWKCYNSPMYHYRIKLKRWKFKTKKITTITSRTTIRKI